MTVRNSVADAVRAEVAALPEPLHTSVLAAAALDLATRLDGNPEDRAAAMLVRELRLVMAELHRRAGLDVGDELEVFLGGISAPAFRGPGD